MLSKEKIEKANKAREILKPLSIGDFTTWFNSDGIVEMESSMQTLFQYIDQLEQENKTLKQCLIDNNTKDVNEHLYLGNSNM